MTSDEESYHSAQANTSKLNSLSNSDDNDGIVPDSAGSLSESDNEPGLNNELLFNNDIQLSESSEDETDEDSPSRKREADGFDLPLSKRLRERTTPSTTAKLDRSTKQTNRNFKLLQESDLTKLNSESEKLKTMSSLQSMVQQESPDGKHNKNINEKAHNNKINLLENLANKDTIKKSLVDSIINETVTNKYHDWHFIKYNCAKTIDNHQLKDIMYSIGCIKKPFNKYQLVIRDEDITKFDSYCTMFPVKYILDEIFYYYYYYNITEFGYVQRSELFRFIICLLLDKKIFESAEIYDKDWTIILSDIAYGKDGSWKLNVEEELTKVLSELKDKRYFISHRLCSILPKMKPILIKQFFDNNPENIIIEFNKILDEKKYEKLLYFVMFVYGSSLLPFEQDDNNNSEEIKSKLEKNNIHIYFSECIYDLAQRTTSEVEVSLIKSLLNIYSKVI